MHHTYNWRDGSQRMRIRYFDILLGIGTILSHKLHASVHLAGVDECPLHDGR